MAKYTNIDKGPRGLNTTQGKVWAEPGETVDVKLAEGEEAPEAWFRAEKAMAATPKTSSIKAIHHGGGKFNVVDGDEVLLSGLSKADADSFNEKSDEDKAAYIAAEKAKG